MYTSHLPFLKHILITGFLCSLVACGSTSEDRDDDDSVRADCIYQPSIRGYTVLDESNLIVRASGRRSYHVTLQRRAHGLRSSWGIAFGSPTGRVCPKFGEVIFRGGPYDAESITIASIRSLKAEDEDDLLVRFGKKEPEIEHTPEPLEVEGAEVEELDPDA